MHIARDSLALRRWRSCDASLVRAVRNMYTAMFSGSLETHVSEAVASTMTTAENNKPARLCVDWDHARNSAALSIQFSRDCNKTFEKLCVVSTPRVVSRVSTACYATRIGYSSVKI
jgi:hypothetical protein